MHACIELGYENPPGANYCGNCGERLTRPERSAEPRWGVYLRNQGINEVEDNVHESEDAAVVAALRRSPQIADSPMPYFVGLIGPDHRIHEWRPVTFGSEGQQFTIGDPIDHDELLDVSFLESAVAPEA